MSPREIFLYNPVLLAGSVAWILAQILKVLIEYIKLRKWNWALLFQAGGMPSSHSAIVSATSLSIGMLMGFETGIFALSAVLAMIVIYDATGIRRQAGKQAVVINNMIDEITKGKIPPQDRLKEVLGHTPGEAVMGTLLGLVIAFLISFFMV